MPGGYEIRRTIEQCQRAAGGQALSIFPLYSELPAAEQDAALAAAPNRKVIVSTNVAETSITIPGIRHVIDSGLARVNRFDPRRGVNVLMIEPISQASAEQRAGRAGRTAPGTCYRLWPEPEHRHRPAHTTPEIQRLDLAEVVLHLYSLGIRDVAAFPWLEPPSEVALRQAIETLVELDALGGEGSGIVFRVACVRATSRNRSPSPGTRPHSPRPHHGALPMHPRLSRLLVEATQRGCLQRAALWAAFISERDILIPRVKHPFVDDMPETFPRSDFLVLEAAFEFARKMNFDADRCGIRASTPTPAGKSIAPASSISMPPNAFPLARERAGVRDFAQALVRLPHLPRQVPAGLFPRSPGVASQRKQSRLRPHRRPARPARCRLRRPASRPCPSPGADRDQHAGAKIPGLGRRQRNPSASCSPSPPRSIPPGCASFTPTGSSTSA